MNDFVDFGKNTIVRKKYIVSVWANEHSDGSVIVNALDINCNNHKKEFRETVEEVGRWSDVGIERLKIKAKNLENARKFMQEIIDKAD